MRRTVLNVMVTIVNGVGVFILLRWLIEGGGASTGAAVVAGAVTVWTWDRRR